MASNDRSDIIVIAVVTRRGSPTPSFDYRLDEPLKRSTSIAFSANSRLT